MPLTMGLLGVGCGQPVGGELGTTSSLICAVLMGVCVKTLPKSTMSMVPLPDLTTKAWLVTGSTARPPKRVREFVVPFCTVSVGAPVPESLIWAGSIVGLTRQGEESGTGGQV